MSKEGMVKLLAQGADPTRLQRTSPAILDDLYQRVTIGEIVLSYDEALGDVVGDYWSVRTAIEAHGWELREIGRIDLRTGIERIHPEPKYYGATETALPHERETPLRTAERGFLEEWGVTSEEYVTVPMLLGAPDRHHREHEAFKGVLCLDHLNPSPAEPEIHPSSVYPLLSRVHVTNTRLVMPRRLYPGGRKLKDGHILLLLKWFPVFPILAAGT